LLCYLAAGSLALVAPVSTAANRTVLPPADAGPANAPVALLVDLSSGQTLYAHEAQRRFIPASITKVMTAFLAFELIEEGRLSPRQVFVVDEYTGSEWGGVGSTMFLETGDRVQVDDLISGITSVSANDGSVALAIGAMGSVDAWVNAMNAKARELGLRDSHFGTPNGWMDEGRTYVSARDLVTLAKAMITRHPALYRHYFGREGFAYNGIAQDNHDPLSGSFEGADGIKTGYTRQAGFGYLGSAVRNGRRLALVVAAAPSGPVRNRASRALMEWGFANFAVRPLYRKGEVVGRARVQGGAAPTVPLVPADDLSLSLPRGAQHGQLGLAIRYLGPLPAPIRKGDEVAELVVSLPGGNQHAMTLIAGEDVAPAGFFSRIRNGLAGLAG